MLSIRGWTTFTLPLDSDLCGSLENLLAASKRFFDTDLAYKARFRYPEAGSEQGWSRIEGEKEMITLRTTNTTPPELREGTTMYIKKEKLKSNFNNFNNNFKRLSL